MNFIMVRIHAATAKAKRAVIWFFQKSGIFFRKILPEQASSQYARDLFNKF